MLRAASPSPGGCATRERDRCPTNPTRRNCKKKARPTPSRALRFRAANSPVALRWRPPWRRSRQLLRSRRHWVPVSRARKIHRLPRLAHRRSRIRCRMLPSFQWRASPKPTLAFRRSSFSMGRDFPPSRKMIFTGCVRWFSRRWIIFALTGLRMEMVPRCI